LENNELGHQFAQAALKYLGVPFAAHGRSIQGVDCAGLLFLALPHVGRSMPDYHYTLAPGADLYGMLTGSIKAVADEMPEGAALEEGDILTMRYLGMNNHCGIYLGNSMLLHAVEGGRKAPAISKGVIRTPMDYSVRSRVRSIWRLR